MKLNTQIELNGTITNVVVDFDIEGDPDGNIATINSIITETGKVVPYSAEYDFEFECRQIYTDMVFYNYMKYGRMVYDINDPK